MLRCRKRIFVTPAVIFLSLCCLQSLFAEEQETQRLVTKVEVEGNKNISGATILSKVRTRKGSTFSELVASDDLKRLYALGYFTDINIDIADQEGGVAVIFRVVEKPILSKISISGNKSIRTEKLEKLIKSKTDEFFNVQQLKQDMRDIQKAYEARGYPLADIDYQLETDEETNEAKAKIVIQEKMRVKIKGIKIEGNEEFSDKRILKLMRTRRDTLFTSGVYREEVLDLDLERINSFYEQNGFLDIEVTCEKSFGPKKKKMYITIKINEGKQYRVGEIKIQGALLFPENEIRSCFDIKPDEVFSKDKLRYDVSKVQSFYFEKGYISAEVDVDTILNDKTGRIDLLYRITENELAYIDKIKISGNTKTRDIVILSM